MDAQKEIDISPIGPFTAKYTFSDTLLIMWEWNKDKQGQISPPLAYLLDETRNYFNSFCLLCGCAIASDDSLQQFLSLSVFVVLLLTNTD